MKTSDRDPIPPGTLEMLVLKTLARGREMHGFEIAEAIHQQSDEVLQVEEGSLYPALQRMLRRGWVRSEWRVTEHNRRARYYLITPAGRRRLEAETVNWERTSAAVNGILRVRLVDL